MEIIHWITEYSLEGLMLTLKLQYFGHLIQRTNSLEKTLMLGTTEGRRRRGDRGWDGWHYRLNGHEFEDTLRQWRAGKPGVLQCMGWQRVGQNLVAEQQQIVTNKASCPREIQFIFIAFDLLLEKMTKLNMIFPLVCKTFYCTCLLFAIWFCNCSYLNH